MPGKYNHFFSQVGHCIAETASGGAARVYGPSELPFRFAEGIISVYSLKKNELNTQEKATHVLQAVLCFGQTVLHVAMHYTDKDSPLHETLQTTNTVLSLLYTGVLLTTTMMTSAEAYKKFSDGNPPEQEPDPLPHARAPDATASHPTAPSTVDDHGAVGTMARV